MLTLRCLENISFKTPDAIITKTPGEKLKINDLAFCLSLVEAGKAEIEMDDLMQELLNLDLITNSDLYLEERISASETVVEAYRAGTKAQFIQQALALIKVYLKCQKK